MPRRGNFEQHPDKTGGHAPDKDECYRMMESLKLSRKKERNTESADLRGDANREVIEGSRRFHGLKFKQILGEMLADRSAIIHI